MICEGHWYCMNTKEPVGAGHNNEVVNIEEILRHFVHADTGARSLWLFQICSLYSMKCSGDQLHEDASRLLITPTLVLLVLSDSANVAGNNGRLIDPWFHPSI